MWTTILLVYRPTKQVILAIRHQPYNLPILYCFLGFFLFISGLKLIELLMMQENVFIVDHN